MLKVGLTGNIGSGKTIVAQVFKSLGVAVFHADPEAKKQYNKESIRDSIREIFGDVVFSPVGEVLKPVLAEIVFNDPDLLQKLNNIIHPGVRKDYFEWYQQYIDEIYTLFEAAILFESGHYKEMDRIICVTAPAELRIRRVMERDHLSRREVERRMDNQWDEARKVALADYVIINDESSSVIMQVMKIHNDLVQSSKFKVQS